MFGLSQPLTMQMFQPLKCAAEAALAASPRAFPPHRSFGGIAALYYPDTGIQLYPAGTLKSESVGSICSEVINKLQRLHPIRRYAISSSHPGATTDLFLGAILIDPHHQVGFAGTGYGEWDEAVAVGIADHMGLLQAEKFAEQICRAENRTNHSIMQLVEVMRGA